jgi:hypothetical protein
MGKETSKKILQNFVKLSFLLLSFSISIKLFQNIIYEDSITIKKELKFPLNQEEINKTFNWNILNLFLNFLIDNGIQQTLGDIPAHWLTLCTNGLAFNSLLVYYISRKIKEGGIMKIGSI